jgi:hypothetical protein
VFFSVKNQDGISSHKPIASPGHKNALHARGFLMEHSSHDSSKEQEVAVGFGRDELHHR